jgi:hypothetical protein
MGWYLRKSLKIGLLRLNLSKSGLGASVGVKGLRVGTGPRGKYLHAGREGLYYRESLESKRNSAGGMGLPENAPTEFNGSKEDQLAAARWARINARAEQLGDARRDDTGRGFFSAFIAGLFGGLMRGR